MGPRVDRFIEAFPSVVDGDLMLCLDHGVAYQRDMSYRIDVPYFDIYNSYSSADQKIITDRIIGGRVALVADYAGRSCNVLDIGTGSGEFIRRRPNTWGFDVDQKAVEWMKLNDRWSDKIEAFLAFTFWDVLEHIENPGEYFGRMVDRVWLFTCIPIFSDLRRIRESRHYRPGEHMYYFTEKGFVDWVALHQFRLRKRDDFETRAGRESIVSFAFQRSMKADAA